MKNYEKILKSGDVLSCTSHKFLAKQIQKFTKSKLNHSAYVVELWGSLYIVDSQRRGTTPKDLSYWMEKYNYDVIIHRRISIAEMELKDQNRRAMTICGETPYDFITLFILHPINELFNVWLGRKGKRAEKRMVCSETVGMIIKCPNAYKLTPIGLYEYLENDKRYVKIDDNNKDIKSITLKDLIEVEEQIEKELDDINEFKI